MGDNSGGTVSTIGGVNGSGVDSSAVTGGSSPEVYTDGVYMGPGSNNLD